MGLWTRKTRGSHGFTPSKLFFAASLNDFCQNQHASLRLRRGTCVAQAVGGPGSAGAEVGDQLLRLGVGAIPFGIAAVVSGFVLKAPGTQAGPADIELLGPSVSVFGTIHPDIFRLRAPLGSGPPGELIRLASLDPQVGSDALGNGWGMVTDTSAAACRKASSDERFAVLDDRPASFNRRFASVDDCPASFDESFGSAMQALASNLRLPPDPFIENAARLAEPNADSPRMAALLKRHIRPGQTRGDSIAMAPPSVDTASPSSALPQEDDRRTAIYDITAAAVYLPDGRKLEAHSGIGELRDNPHHAHKRMRGATPPNVYKLSLRERKFHGVRALRLTPVDERKMHGRDGILAHSFLLGPKGNSHGCVAFRNYPEFLNAFLKGEITRIVVVARLETPPGPVLAAGQLPDSVREMLKVSDRSRQLAAATGGQ
jgi:hypothetical protein